MESSAAGPRVYVPISHPDSPVPTYAVLQFLGISPPPDPSQSPALVPHLSSPMHILPCSSPVLLPCSSPVPVPACASPAPLPCASPAPNPPSPVPKLSSTFSTAESANSSSSDEKDRKLTSIKPSPMKKSASGSSISSSCLSPGARRSGKILPTISITHTNKDTIIHTHSSKFREVVHQLTGASNGEKGLMPVTLPARTTAIVRSGAGNDKDPASSAASSPRIMLHHGNGNAPESSAIKPAGHHTTKLLERRKSNKILERLSTSCRNLPPMVPSPVTPLASDFEKIHLPVTPTSSEGSLTPVRNLVASTGSLATDSKAMEILTLSGATPSHKNKIPLHTRSAKAMLMDDKGCFGDGLDMQGPRTPPVMHSHSLSLYDGIDDSAPIMPSKAIGQSTSPLAIVNGPGPRLVLANGAGDASLFETMDMQDGEEIVGAHDAMDTEDEGVQDLSPHGKDAGADDEEEIAIAKRGFFFHSERPRHGDPTLLSLFPESPREL